MSFEDWYFELENYCLRAERLVTNRDELEAAYNAGRQAGDCHSCGRDCSYVKICSTCMIEFNKLKGV